MEAQGSGNEGNEISPEVMYGELDALLNEITATSSDVKKPDSIANLKDSIIVVDDKKEAETHEAEGIETFESLDNVKETESPVQNDLKEGSDSALVEAAEREDELNKSLQALNEEVENIVIKNEPELIIDDNEEEEDIKSLEPVEDLSAKPESAEDSTENITAESQKPLEEEPSSESEKVTETLSPNLEEEPSSESEKVTETLSPNLEEEPKAPEDKIVIESSETISEIESTKTSEELAAKSSKEPEASSLKPKAESEPTQRSESPNELLNMLKKLSPEKLEEIKSKIFDDKKKKQLNFDEKEVKVEVEKAPATEVVQNTKTPPNTSKDDDDDCVILLDSDEEEPAAPPPPKPAVEISKKPDVTFRYIEAQPTPAAALKTPTASAKRKPEKSNENGTSKMQKKTKECINPDCPRDSNSYEESPLFILSFYYATKKPNKVQLVCSSCFDKAIIKYEELSEAMLSNKPLSSVQLHKKHEMVEVIDSDDEDGPNEVRVVPDDEKIIFDRNVELQVESILQSLCNKIDLKQQLDWDHENIQKGLDVIDFEQSLFDEELKKLEKKSSNMYNELYSINKPKIQRRPSLDITHEIEPRQSAEAQAMPSPRVPTGYPPPGTKVVICPPKQAPKTPESLMKMPAPGQKIIISPMSAARMTVPLQIPRDQTHYALRFKVEGKMQNWSPCKLLETTRMNDGVMTYRVQFQDNQISVVTGKEFAKSIVNLGLTIGARVIALFSTKPTRQGIKPKDNTKKFLPGVIGEKRSKYNKFRYLVFCDYGQVQYCSSDDVREISEASANVTDDVHRNLKQFIEDYLQSQTQGQRPLLNVRVGQRVYTERNSAWQTALIAEVDCSLVKMHFQNDSAFEWIYRGSKRFGPLFTQQQQRGANKNARRNDPNISYITVDSDEEQQAEGTPPESSAQADVAKKNTARKSTAPPPPQRVQAQQQHAQPEQAASGSTSIQKTIILNDNNIYLEDPNKVTKHRHFTPRKDIAAKKYVHHDCTPACLGKTGNLAAYSPLTKPLLTCWERQIVRQKTNKWIVYKAPCGRRLRNMYEIRRYLMITQCPLNVDNFDFDINMQVLAAYDVADKNLCPLYIPDMSEGKEGMKVPVINAFDDTAPPKLIYSADRIPMKGVHINTDPDFMACCDCTDDCADKTKCACFQMTIRGLKFASRDEITPDEDISYVWKRLLAQVTTGIYECHSRCKCSSRCLNKVVQQPIQIKMQLYRTKNRGWGLESCHDIPKGTFICIYAGQLYPEDDANALCQGLDHGDEYFAELDLIETAAPLKEDFESGVIHEDSETDEGNSDSDYDEKNAEEDDDFMSTAKAKGNREILTRSARGSRHSDRNPQDPKNSNESDSDDDIVNMLPSTGNASGATPKTGRSLRKLYGKNEKVYIMDAKTCGNVGRYFNHSCDPNLFVQSVFVDTHDMRFPWIAFFAARPIKAGEELTWNYNYEVGSVASKVLFCKCEAKNCRGRIL